MNLMISADSSEPVRVEVLAREPNPVQATFPSEVLTCRTPGGDALRIFLKRGGGVAHHSHGHRGGVQYETTVYDRILRPIGMSTPPLYGHGADDGGWMAIGLMADAARMHKHIRAEEAVVDAASWIGEFHARAAALDQDEMDLLQAYDAAYYCGWARRTVQYADDAERRYPWLGELCAWYEDVCAPGLVKAAQTVVHGELYPRNILLDDHGVHPVDWESAALGAGEIDFVALTEGWPADVVKRARKAYVDARWAGDEPSDFSWNCDAARMYITMRWLGDRPYWTNLESAQYEFEALRAIGRRMAVGHA